MTKQARTSWAGAIVAALVVIWLLARKASAAPNLDPSGANVWTVANQGLGVSFPLSPPAATNQTQGDRDLDQLMASTYGTGVAGQGGQWTQAGY